jgi:uncharacterized membrane protein YbhN (UPF0104 family)
VPLLVVALVATALSVVLPGVLWVQILRWLGFPAPWRWLRLYLQAQLGKYVPGGVWQYAGRAALAQLRGAPLRLTTLSLGVELAAGSAVGAAVGVAALYPVPGGLAVLGVVVAACALRFRRPALPAFVWRLLRVDRRELATVSAASARAALLFVPMWLVHGVSLWLVSRALFGAPAHELGYYVGAFAIGWLAGLAAVFAPGGIGVREAVLTAFLTPKLGAANAIVVAGTSRMLFVAVDLVVGAGALALAARGRRTAVVRPPLETASSGSATP